MKKFYANTPNETEKWMIVICGPNGAGKSTLYENFLKSDPFLGKAEFINLDVEAALLSDENKTLEDVMMDAGRNIKGKIAEKLQGTETFIYETTSAGRSQFKFMDQAREHGFKIASVFIGLSSAKLSLLRVKERVENGGHDVPEDIIERRFPNVMKNFPEMLKRSDVSVAFDNSYKAPYKLIFMMDRRKLFVFHSYPKWLEKALQNRKTSRKIVHITKEEVSQMSAEKIMEMSKQILDSFNGNSK